MDQRQPTMVARPGTFTIPLTATTVQHHYTQQSPSQAPAQVQQVQQPRPSVNRSYYQQEPADPHKMEQSYSRSVTIVYWHKAGSDPIRVRKDIPTFPWFQLSQCTDIVTEVGLTASTYVDAFNPSAGTWEQETITAVRCVEGEQRLLYRSRKSLLEGLVDRECPGLDHEIKLQAPSVPKKRSLPDSSAPDGYHPNKQYKVSHASFAPASEQAPAFPQNLSAPDHVGSPQILPGSPYLQHSPQHPLAQSPSAAGAAVDADSFTPHPPLKRWPNDYAVCEIAAGLAKMDELVNQTPSLTQKAAFERVFGCRYVKSTVCRHRGVWRKADKGLRETFERMGTDERALWGEFVKRTDFRRDKKSSGQQGRHDEEGDDSQEQQHQHHPQQHQQQHQQHQHQHQHPGQGHHQLEYGMPVSAAAAMGSLGLGLVDPGVAMGVNGGMDDGLNGNQSPLGALGPQT